VLEKKKNFFQLTDLNHEKQKIIGLTFKNMINKFFHSLALDKLSYFLLIFDYFFFTFSF
jgi:hypothetical protein